MPPENVSIQSYLDLVVGGMMMREQETVLCLEEKYSEKQEAVSVRFG